MEKEIILASASPRRRELLKQIGIVHRVVPALKEECMEGNCPIEIVQKLALCKAKEVALGLKIPQKTVLGADTIVVMKNCILGKPDSDEQAFCMLKDLQGKIHQVYTGVAFLEYLGEEKGETKWRELIFYEETKVEIYPMTDEEIEAYIQTGDGRDKAGSYGIQGAFSAYIKGIEGDYFNVVGLPVGRVYQELKHWR